MNDLLFYIDVLLGINISFIVLFPILFIKIYNIQSEIDKNKQRLLLHNEAGMETIKLMRLMIDMITHEKENDKIIEREVTKDDA